MDPRVNTKFIYVSYIPYIHKFESNFIQYFCWPFVLTVIHDVRSRMEFSTCGAQKIFNFETFWIRNTQPMLE